MNFEAYRQAKAQEITEVVMQMMSCPCTNCRNVPPREKHKAISQALVDATADHIFAGSAADVSVGESSMINALHDAKKQLIKCFEEFQIPETGGLTPNNQGENNGSNSSDGGSSST